MKYRAPLQYARSKQLTLARPFLSRYYPNHPLHAEPTHRFDDYVLAIMEQWAELGVWNYGEAVVWEAEVNGKRRMASLNASLDEGEYLNLLRHENGPEVGQQVEAAQLIEVYQRPGVADDVEEGTTHHPVGPTLHPRG